MYTFGGTIYDVIDPNKAIYAGAQLELSTGGHIKYNKLQTRSQILYDAISTFSYAEDEKPPIYNVIKRFRNFRGETVGMEYHIKKLQKHMKPQSFIQKIISLLHI